MKTCVVPGCAKPRYGRGLCPKHYYRAKRTGRLWQYPTVYVRHEHPINPATMPDMPETEEPIVPNPAHYQPWECFRDGMLPCWDSWLAMRSRMAALEERDALRDARDAERYDVAFVDGQLVVRVREQVAA